MGTPNAADNAGADNAGADNAADNAATDNTSRAPALAAGGIYCRGCDYDLRGQVEARCPECGREFDFADSRSTRRRPRRRWVRRVVLAAIALLILAAAPFAWLYYDWHGEQAAVRHFQANGAGVRLRSIDVPLLSKVLPERCGWMLDRVQAIDNLTATPLPDDFRLAATCRRVEVLWLANSPVTRAGVEAIAGLPRLRALRLEGPGINDASAQRLGQMRSIDALYLCDTSLSDAGLAHLCCLPELRYLEIGSPRLTSAGLDALGGLPKLDVLYLDGPALDDDALTKLARLTRLKGLYIYDGRFAPAAVDRLKQALPNCDVVVFPNAILPSPPATNPATAP